MDAFKEWLLGSEAQEYTALHFEFGIGISLPFAALLFAVVAAISIWFWARRLHQLRRPTRIALVSMRTLIALLILFLLLGPTINARKLQPSEHYVAVLFDDSRSMQIVGEDGSSRADRLRRAYAASAERLDEVLGRTHQVAMYRFGEYTERIDSVDDLTFEQRESDLVGAIESAQRELAGTSIAAVVLFSDGVEQVDAARDAEELLAGSAPIFAVGTDTASTWRDLELTDLTVARTNFDKSPVEVTLRANAQGLDGESAVAEVLHGDRVVASKAFNISGSMDEYSARLEFVPAQNEWLRYEARVRLGKAGATGFSAAVAAAGKDSVAANNARDFVVDNREKIYRILYFSGRPNWENKFVARALEADPQLKLSSLLRVSGAERKFEYRGRSSSLANPLFEGFEGAELLAPRYDEAVFIRLGLREDELADGYPFEEKDLYPFHLVIWGDIEREFFDSKHFELTRDYVAKRGGAFMLLGGPRAFAAGNYGGTIIESMLPVMLTQGQDDGYMAVPFRAEPSVEGFLSGMWALAADEEQSLQQWHSLPPLTGVNYFPMVRAGGNVLARVDTDGSEPDDWPLFVMQRYGEGVCAVMAAGESWPWHMQTPNANDDHGRFWRQTIRGLVKEVPEPVRLISGIDDLTVSQANELKFVVRDETFTEREGLNTAITATPENGPAVELPVEESIENSGVYTAEFAPEDPGRYVINLTASTPEGETIGTMEQALVVHPDHREFQSARYDREFLEEIAALTEGGFYTLDQLASIPGEVPWPEGQHAVWRRIELWHWTGFFVLLAVLWSTEWYLRRRRGQA